MKRKNTARNALFTSIISLLLCVTMLVGATFAWFTDKVESGRNTIAAGNLDIELYNQDGPVTESTVLFDDVTPNLWEPGAVAYEDLQIKNVGSLALQYSLELNVLEETVVNGYKLSDVIMVGIVEGGVGDATREEAIASVTSWTKLCNFKFNQNGVKLEAGEETPVYGVVLYWQPNDNDTDNRYNMNNGNKGNVLKLEIGVSLIASQVMHEGDSFGNDYDSKATPYVGAIDIDWYTANPDAAEFVVSSPEELAGLAAIVNGTATTGATTYDLKSETAIAADSFKGKTVKLGGNIDLTNATWTPIGASSNAFQGTFDGQGYTVSNLKVTGFGSNVGLFGNTNSGEIKNLTVENANVSGRLNVAVVAGNPYTSKYTNITVKGHIEVNGMSYVGAVGGKNAYANWDNITVNADETSYVKANSVENGTAYRTYVGGVIGFMGEGGHKVSNVTSNIDVIGSTRDVGGIVGIAHYGNKFENIVCTGDVTITNATSATSAEEIGGIAGVWNNGGADVTMTNCVFSGTLNVSGTEGVDLSDNTITGKPYGTGNGKLIIDGKITSVVSGTDTLKDALNNAQAGDTVFVTAGTYTFPTSSLKEGVVLNCAEGTVFEGTSKLNINGATVIGATFSNPSGTAADQTINGTFKNCTFTGKNGLRWCYAGDTVVFENCVFDGSTYGVHFDGGANEVIFKDCTISGFNAMGGAITMLKMEGCTFKPGRSGYNGINLWGSVEMTDCTFLFDGTKTEWIDLCGSNTTASFTNCVVTNGVTEKDIKTVIGNYGAGNTVTVDGEAVVFSAEELTAAVAAGETVIYLRNGSYDLKGNQKDGLTLIGIGSNVKMANSTNFASAGKLGGIVKAIRLENVTVTDTVYTMAEGGSAVFTDVNFAAGFRKAYGTNIVFNGCSFGSNSEGYALHFESDGTSTNAIQLNDCVFEGGKVHLGRGRTYVFSGCDFAAGTDFQVWGDITLENCTVNGEKVTAENMATLFPDLNAAKVTLK